jgi:hypothetical protein
VESKFNPQKLIFQAAACLVPLIVYIITLAPTVTFIDSGELAAVCIKLGVAHPTGYPLFTILGNLFSKLPIGEEIYRLNVMCAVISSLTTLIFFNLLVFTLTGLKLNTIAFKPAEKEKKAKAQKEKTSAKEKEKKLSPLAVYFVSLSASLILAFSTTFWNTATAIEVYSLHTLFIVSIIYMLLKAGNSLGQQHDTFFKREKYWLGFAFVLGLSFTNHLSTIFLSVGCLYLYLSLNGFNKESFTRIGYMAIPFILGLTVYFYLPLRADNPVLAWGDPGSWENFYRHVSGKQFSVWMFTSSENAGKQLSYFMKSFPKEFVYLPLLAAVAGLFALYGRNKRLFIFTVLLFVFNVLYAINYDIYDIDSYFLLAYITCSIWIGYGLYFIVSRVKENYVTVSAATLLIAALPLTQNFKQNNESDNYYVQDYTMNVFASAPKNAIILSSQWDFWVSASIYYQYVKDVRPDIAVIDKELLRKSWYLKHLEKHYPDIYEKSKAEFEAYKFELIKFENQTERYTQPKTEADRQDLMRIQTAFANLLNSMVDKNYGVRDFFTTFEIEQAQQERFGKDYKRVPEGLLIKYSKDTGFDNYPEPKFSYRIANIDDYHHGFINNAYYSAFLSRANYLMNFSKYAEAEALINKAIEVYPSKQDAHQLMNKLRQLKAMGEK